MEMTSANRPKPCAYFTAVTRDCLGNSLCNVTIMLPGSELHNEIRAGVFWQGEAIDAFLDITSEFITNDERPQGTIGLGVKLSKEKVFCDLSIDCYMDGVAKSIDQIITELFEGGITFNQYKAKLRDLEKRNRQQFRTVSKESDRGEVNA